MERGALLFSYRPPRAHPILYAGLILFAVVFLIGWLEATLRHAPKTLLWGYAAPLLATVALMLVLRPSDVRIHANGVAPSRPLPIRWRRPFLAWAAAEAVYPVYYDVTGAFVSPFASSDGKVTQVGLGLEMKDGHLEVVRFTPTRLTMGHQESRGYLEALDVVRRRFDELGRPLARHAPSYTEAQRAAMLAEANRPFLPFFVILVLLVSTAPVVVLLTRIPWFAANVGAALAVGLVAPTFVMVQSYRRSRRRNAILNALSKSAEVHG